MNWVKERNREKETGREKEGEREGEREREREREGKRGSGSLSFRYVFCHPKLANKKALFVEHIGFLFRKQDSRLFKGAQFSIV